MKLFDNLGIRFPKNIKNEYKGLGHEALFGTENENNISNPIIKYMLNDSDGAYVPLK